ncbi:MAG: rhodanese-like domain-containing protein [Acidimicrobiales bacterium]
MTRTLRLILLPLGLALLVAAGCGSSSGDSSSGDGASGQGDGRGVRLVSVQEGVDLQNSAPDGLIILDVRTPEEFAEGHLEGARMIDFYLDDFADRIAELDPDVPYLVYCRSGNRSGQTVAIMEELGFSDVADVDGGIMSWLDAGLPTVTQ